MPDETPEDQETPVRHDVKLNLGKKRGRPKKQAPEVVLRHDSPATAAVDGYGEPFEVNMKPGFKAYWATEKDQRRLARRPWDVATWGDPRIVDYDFGSAIPAAVRKGSPIKYNELTLMIMRDEDAAVLRQRDPRFQAREAIRRAEEEKAANSGDPQHRGKFGVKTYYQKTISA